MLDSQVPATGELALAGGAVTIEAHPALTGARARVGAAASPTRDAVGARAAPTALVRDPSVAVPLSLGTAPPGSERAPDHVELRGDLDPAQVSRESPLRLQLRATVEPDDVVVAIARDGELYLPLGIGTAADNDRVEIELHRLPGGPEDDEAAGRPVQIFFQRVLGHRLGADPGRPRLSVAGLDDDPARVAAAVEAAGKVLLLVPGPLGDSRAMVRHVTDAVAGRYDAVLAYDFDPIGTVRAARRPRPWPSSWPRSG